MNRWKAIVVSVFLTAAVNPFLVPSASGAECTRAPREPWAGVEVGAPTRENADAVLEALSHDPGVAFAGSWYTSEDILHVGIAGPTGVASPIVAATQNLRGPTVQLDVVPYSWAELETIQEKIDAHLASEQVPFVTEKRPDVGRLIVRVDPEFVDTVKSQVTTLAPECVALVEGAVGLSEFPYDIDRNSQPPHKGGKRLRLLNPAGTFNCESGFVFEADGGNRLFGSTSGHCAKGEGRRVTDKSEPYTTVGYTETPNLFWRNEPAVADAVLYDLVFSRSQVQAAVITVINPDDSRVVEDRVPESNISAGSQGCRALQSIDQHCGGIAGVDITRGSFTTDPVTGDPVFKTVRNLYCFDEDQAVGGDSGAPTYRLIQGGGIKAMGLHSNSSPSTGDCFSPQSRIGNELGAHVWLGN